MLCSEKERERSVAHNTPCFTVLPFDRIKQSNLLQVEAEDTHSPAGARQTVGNKTRNTVQHRHRVSESQQQRKPSTRCETIGSTKTLTYQYHTVYSDSRWSVSCCRASISSSAPQTTTITCRAFVNVFVASLGETGEYKHTEYPKI